MKHIGISLFVLCSQAIVVAQTPEIIWEHSYGGNGDDRGHKVIATPDGGYLFAGYGNSIDGEFDVDYTHYNYLAVKTDADGNVEWSHAFGGNGYDYCFSACPGVDGGYVLAGKTSSTDGDITFNHGLYDAWIVKLDDAGTLLWQKSYGGSNQDGANDIISTSDGNYILAGQSASNDGNATFNHGGFDYWLVKIDPTGEIIWQKSYGGSNAEQIWNIIETGDGGFAVAGYTQSYDGDVTGGWGGLDYWIIKTDPEGVLQWQHAYGGSETDWAFSIVEKAGGGFFVVGETYSEDGLITGSHGSIDCWLLNLDSGGNLLWQHAYGGSGGEHGKSAVNPFEDKIYFLSTSQDANGDITSNYGLSDFWLICTDTIGTIMWQKSFGGSEGDLPNSLLFTTDSCFLAAGHTYSSDYDVTETYASWNFWLVKLGTCSTLYYADADGDGFGDVAIDTLACNLPAGYVTDSTDCDDGNAGIYPGAEDICNAIDDNCNGEIDEDALFITYYADMDGDAFGDAFADSSSCFIPVGFVLDNTDCDDTNENIYPGAEDICNAIDDNCNGEIDEDALFITYYADTDGDTFGDVFADSSSCFVPVGFVLDNTDCDDTNESIYPGATEVCNFLDDDCDGYIDDNLAFVWLYQDADNDNYGNATIDTLTCESLTGYVPDSTDCNDTNPDIYPGATEILNGLDDDCDGVADEGLAVEENTSPQISLYPNPAQSAITLVFSSIKNEPVQAEICNNIGEKIRDARINNVVTEVDISALTDGVYFVIITIGDGKFVLPFVKTE